MLLVCITVSSGIPYCVLVWIGVFLFSLLTVHSSVNRVRLGSPKLYMF